MINDWIDFIGICGLSFLIIVIGVWVLPQLPEKTHFIVALSIILSSIFFTRKAVDFIVESFKEHFLKEKGGKIWERKNLVL